MSQDPRMMVCISLRPGAKRSFVEIAEDRIARHHVGTAREDSTQAQGAGNPYHGTRNILFLLMSFVSIFPLATGVRWRYGYGFGDEATRVGNRTANGQFHESWKMWTAGLVWDSFLAGPVFSPFFLFWDHWKAIYPCVVRFDSWGGFFFVASRTCFLWYSVISLYISFFEIETFLDLALN